MTWRFPWLPMARRDAPADAAEDANQADANQADANRPMLTGSTSARWPTCVVAAWWWS